MPIHQSSVASYLTPFYHKFPHYANPPVTCRLVTHTNLSQISSLCQSTSHLSPRNSHQFITNLLIMPIHQSPFAYYLSPIYHKSPHYANLPVTCRLVTHTNLSQISSLCQSNSHLSPPTPTPIYHKSPHYANPTVTCRLLHPHQFITNLLIMPIHQSPFAYYLSPMYHKSPHYANPPVTHCLVHSHQFPHHSNMKLSHSILLREIERLRVIITQTSREDSFLLILNFVIYVANWKTKHSESKTSRQSLSLFYF